MTPRGGRSLLNPILALFRDDDGQNPAFDVEAFAEKRGTTVESILNEAVGLLPGSVCGIYTYWRSHDRRHRKSASEFLTGKVGRNDPCPCGSGMKYKKCCLN